MQPALSAYISQIDSRLNIAGVINMILTSSKIVAPAIGGVFSITLGETFAFTVSGLMALAAMLFVFWMPSMTQQKSGHKPPTSNVSSPFKFLLLFSMPIVFIDGLSLLFTNVIPYSFSFYSVPKITLSISLSVSAVGNLLMGAFLVKQGKSNGKFPVTLLLFAWLINTLLFGALTWVMPYQAVTVFIIPGIFFFLSIAKTLFDVSLNGYIFQQTKDLAAKLSALRQSVSAGAGITLTIFGAFAINDTPPVFVLSLILALSLCTLISWFILLRQDLQKNSNSAAFS
jgi:predicted MFS family arabinose efflux permease